MTAPHELQPPQLVPPDSVHYRPADTKDDCGACVYFNGDGRSCDRVYGPIFANMLCDLFVLNPRLNPTISLADSSLMPQPDQQQPTDPLDPGDPGTPGTPASVGATPYRREYVSGYVAHFAQAGGAQVHQGHRSGHYILVPNQVGSHSTRPATPSQLSQSVDKAKKKPTDIPPGRTFSDTRTATEDAEHYVQPRPRKPTPAHGDSSSKSPQHDQGRPGKTYGTKRVATTSSSGSHYAEPHPKTIKKATYSDQRTATDDAVHYTQPRPRKPTPPHGDSSSKSPRFDQGRPGKTYGSRRTVSKNNEQDAPVHQLTDFTATRHTTTHSPRHTMNDAADSNHFDVAIASGLFNSLNKSAPSSTSTMIAWYPTSGTAQQLSLPDGEPPHEIHLTLVYLGDITPTQLTTIASAIAPVTLAQPPLSGEISGIGRFNPSPSSDHKTPLVALVDVPGLTAFRTRLVDSITNAGFDVPSTHDFQPHLTIKHQTEGESLLESDIPTTETTPIDISRIWLVRGNQRTHEFSLDKGVGQVSPIDPFSLDSLLSQLRRSPAPARG